jgi:hypothetical protein
MCTSLRFYTVPGILIPTLATAAVKGEMGGLWRGVATVPSGLRTQEENEDEEVCESDLVVELSELSTFASTDEHNTATVIHSGPPTDTFLSDVSE